MQYSEFEKIMSAPRMGRYVTACGGNTRRAMTLYRLNLKLSQEMFTIISCFEIALRNAIDVHYTLIHGNEWLRAAQRPGGIFMVNRCRVSRNILSQGYSRIRSNYTHAKLLAEMDFGFWRYMFAQPQYYAGGQSLIRIFPSKPSSTPLQQYNQTYIFQELKQINDIRNRIAHHEPICFGLGTSQVDSNYVNMKYTKIITLFQWMEIDHARLLYGLDHIAKLTTDLDNI
jgi:hypothetical protein